jgi:hypothetical protein
MQATDGVGADGVAGGAVDGVGTGGSENIAAEKRIGPTRKGSARLLYRAKRFA